MQPSGVLREGDAHMVILQIFENFDKLNDKLSLDNIVVHD